MIKIPIDIKNIALRDLHYSKIKDIIEQTLILKRNSFSNTTIEYRLFHWLCVNIDVILIGNVSKLRSLISDYNALISTFPILPRFKYSKFTINDIKIILNENNLICTAIKKREFLKYLLQNRHRITCLNHILKLQYRDYFYNDIANIFIEFYEKKWDKINDYNRYTFVISHDLWSCPYCNRNYIFTVNKNSNKLRPEIDHFFPKSIYPFLAMSFYNLIPSCQICNHTKKDKDAYADNLKSPYEIDFLDFQFQYKPNGINFYQIKNNKFTNQRFEISLKKRNGVDINDKYFKLELLYNQHKDIVSELLLKKTIYTKSYIKELKTNFRFTDDEIYRFLFCNYLKDKDLHKKPLSKLVKDITQDIGLLLNIK